MTVFFSLTSFCFFYALAIIPFLLNNKHTRIENKYYPIPPDLLTVQREKAEAFARYDLYRKIVIGIGAACFVVGLIGFVAVH